MSKKILVVDDDPVIRMLATEYLSAYGHSIEVFDCGQACLDHLQSQQTQAPDIIVLDLMMPDMNGYEVLNKIKGNALTAKIPIIMLSADSNSDRLAKDQQNRADCYLEKPFEIKNFLEIVGQMTK